MPFKKKIALAKKPTVTVQTKKMSEGGECCSSNGKDGGCCTPKHHCCGKMFFVLLLIVNVALTSMVLIRQSRIESMRVGGDDNYRMLQQVFKSDGFKTQQLQQIQQAMQMYQVPAKEGEEAPALPAAVQ